MPRASPTPPLLSEVVQAKTLFEAGSVTNVCRMREMPSDFAKHGHSTRQPFVSEGQTRGNRISPL